MALYITSSAVVRFQPQADGRISVREQHTDVIGLPHFMDYMAAAGTTQASVQAGLAAHAQTISDALNANEVAANVANALNQIYPTQNYSTNADGIAALRSFWATAVGWPAVQMGNFIFNLNLSDVSLENVFGVAAGAPLTALKARLSSCASQYTTSSVQTGQ